MDYFDDIDDNKKKDCFHDESCDESYDLMCLLGVIEPNDCKCCRGRRGPQGAQGSQGLAGINGTDGAQGVQGSQGLAGINGTNGAQGVQGSQGLAGINGTNGAQGVQGSQGSQGFQGVQSVNVTANSGSAVNTSGALIAVVLAGTPIPLPTQNLISGITVNGGNTVFTVANGGNYLISYHINLTAALLVSSTVVINGANTLALTVAPVLSLSGFSAEAIVTLAGSSTISLELFGLLGAATLLGSGQGAELTIIRLS